MFVLNVIVIFLAFLVSVGFMFTYSFTKWERSSVGINLMLLPVSLISLTVSSLGRRFDLFQQDVADLISIGAWILVVILMTQRIYHVLKAQSTARREERENDNY